MAYTETKTTGYGTRVKNSCMGIGVGFALFIGATVLLWWNEGNSVKTADMLEEAQEACVEMEKPEKKDASLEGELVCATAMATTTDSLVDKEFGVGATAISIQRKVEYYQWIEHSETKTEDKLGGSQEEVTTYTYKKEWSDSPIDSEGFKDPAYQGNNMVLTNVEDEDQWAENVSFGAYKLNENLIKSISSTEDVELVLSDDLLSQLDKNTKEAYERFYKKTTEVKDSVQTDSGYQYIHVKGNEIYYGLNPSVPQVGDVRVTFVKVVPAKVTIISEVTGDTFKPFKAQNGKSFQTLVMGKKTIDEIFEAENSTNKWMTWILRLVGTLLVIAGLKGIFGIIETLLKVVPFLSNIVGWGVGFVCTIVGIVWSLIVIAIAWVFYRPVLGIALLVIAGLLIWIFAFGGKNKIKQLANKKNEEPAQA